MGASLGGEDCFCHGSLLGQQGPCVGPPESRRGARPPRDPPRAGPLTRPSPHPESPRDHALQRPLPDLSVARPRAHGARHGDGEVAVRRGRSCRPGAARGVGRRAAARAGPAGAPARRPPRRAAHDPHHQRLVPGRAVAGAARPGRRANPQPRRRRPRARCPPRPAGPLRTAGGLCGRHPRRPAAANAPRQHGAVEPQPGGAGAGRSHRRTLAGRAVLLPHGDRAGDVDGRRRSARRPGPAGGGAPRGRPDRRRAQERRLPDPRFATLPGAPGPRPRAAGLHVPRASGPPDGRRRRERAGLQSHRPPLGRPARASRRGRAAVARVPSPRLPADARAVRLLHEVQQPRCDRTVLAVGPPPGHAPQGGRAHLAVAGARHPRDGSGPGRRDRSGFRTSAASAAWTWVAGKIGGSLPAADVTLRAADFVVTLGLLTLLFAALFRVAASARPDWADLWLGAFVTALLFNVGRLAIGLYLGRSTTTASFGAAGSVVALLLWMYYSAMIMFFGAEFIQVHTRRHGRRLQPKQRAVLLREETDRRSAA